MVLLIQLPDTRIRCNSAQKQRSIDTFFVMRFSWWAAKRTDSSGIHPISVRIFHYNNCVLVTLSAAPSASVSGFPSKAEQHLLASEEV